MSSTGLHPYWMDSLMRLTKPESRKVAMQLSNTNKLGYQSTRGGPVGKGSLLEFVLKQKEKHPTKVRVRSFCCVVCFGIRTAQGGGRGVPEVFLFGKALDVRELPAVPLPCGTRVIVLVAATRSSTALCLVMRRPV